MTKAKLPVSEKLPENFNPKGPWATITDQHPDQKKLDLRHVINRYDQAPTPDQVKEDDVKETVHWIRIVKLKETEENGLISHEIEHNFGGVYRYLDELPKFM